MFRDSVVVVVRTRPRAIPLAMITMRKSTHGFPFCFPYMGCLWGSAWRPFGPPELRYDVDIWRVFLYFDLTIYFELTNQRSSKYANRFL